VASYYLNIDPGRPLQTLAFAGRAAPAVSDRFTWAERNQLLYDGIATFTVDASGGVLIERAITTYRLNSSGLSDDSYLDVETLFTLFYLRRSARTRVASVLMRTDDSQTFLCKNRPDEISKPYFFAPLRLRVRKTVSFTRSRKGAKTRNFNHNVGRAAILSVPTVRVRTLASSPAISWAMTPPPTAQAKPWCGPRISSRI